MAYSVLAALPPVNGLYVSFFPLIVYAFFGTSRHLAIGSYALVSLLTSSVVEKMVNNYEFNNTSQISSLLESNSTIHIEPDEIKIFKIKVAASLAFLVGLFQVYF